MAWWLKGAVAIDDQQRHETAAGNIASHLQLASRALALVREPNHFELNPYHNTSHRGTILTTSAYDLLTKMPVFMDWTSSNYTTAEFVRDNRELAELVMDEEELRNYSGELELNHIAQTWSNGFAHDTLLLSLATNEQSTFGSDSVVGGTIEHRMPAANAALDSLPRLGTKWRTSCRESIPPPAKRATTPEIEREIALIDANPTPPEDVVGVFEDEMLRLRELLDVLPDHLDYSDAIELFPWDAELPEFAPPVNWWTDDVDTFEEDIYLAPDPATLVVEIKNPSSLVEPSISVQGQKRRRDGSSIDTQSVDKSSTDDDETSSREHKRPRVDIRILA